MASREDPVPVPGPSRGTEADQEQERDPNDVVSFLIEEIDTLSTFNQQGRSTERSLRDKLCNISESKVKIDQLHQQGKVSEALFQLLNKKYDKVTGALFKALRKHNPAITKPDDLFDATVEPVPGKPFAKKRKN